MIHDKNFRDRLIDAWSDSLDQHKGTDLQTTNSNQVELRLVLRDGRDIVASIDEIGSDFIAVSGPRNSAGEMYFPDTWEVIRLDEITRFSFSE